MRTIGSAIIFSTGIIYCIAAHAGIPREGSNVTLRIIPPKHFRQVKSIFLSGNHDVLGNWNPKGISLIRKSDSEWITQFRLPKKYPLEFKINLGDWAHVEVDDRNHEIANRRLECENICEFVIQPENFRISPFHKKPVSARGQIEYFHELYFNQYQNTRSIAVYLPPGYNESSRRYSVLYAADGQNLFDRSTSSIGQEWELDENLEELIAAGRVPPVIVVGIYSTEKRGSEYLMNPKYIEFILKTIKPFVDQRYRTLGDRDHTFFMGSSWGANLALYSGWQFSGSFSRLALVSGDFLWNDSGLIKMIREIRPEFLPSKIWMDMGDREEDVMHNPVEGLNRAYMQLIKSGVAATSIHKEIVVGGQHSETHWAHRVGRILQFLLAGGA